MKPDHSAQDDPVPKKKPKPSSRKGEMKCLGCMKFLLASSFAVDHHHQRPPPQQPALARTGHDACAKM